MVETQFNMFDAAVIGIVALSTMIAFFRGLVREVLSLGAWIGATIITIYLFPRTTQLLLDHVKGNEAVAAGLAAVGTFIVALIGLSILNSILLRYLKTGAEVGILDNMLGLFFGVARGGLIVSLAYVIYNSVALPEDKEQYPEWLKEAKTLPYVEQGADFLREVAPKYLEDMQRDAKEMRDKAAEKGREMRENMEDEELPESLAPLKEE